MSQNGRSTLSRRGPSTLKEILPNVKIITDPKKLAFLEAQAAKAKAKATPRVGRGVTKVGPAPKRRAT